MTLKKHFAVLRLETFSEALMIFVNKLLVTIFAKESVGNLRRHTLNLPLYSFVPNLNNVRVFSERAQMIRNGLI
jgi:hypothetical protein